MSAPDPIYVIGHRNPDTDAICSAIGYAAFLRASKNVDARPARCGELNVRTSWVLGFAGIESPKLLMDVRPNAATVCRRDVLTAKRDETFLSVYRKMFEHGFRSIPVVDDKGRMAGMPTLQELAQLFLPGSSSAHDNRRVRTSLRNIAVALDATLRGNGCDKDIVQDSMLMVGASTPETMRERIRKFPTSTVVVLVGDRPEIQQLAVQENAACLIVTGAFRVSDDLVKEAEQAGIPIIETRHDTASAAQLARFSRPIGDALHDGFLRFTAKTPLKEILAQTHDSHQPLFPVIDEETQKLLGVFSKSDLVDVPRMKLALVDHNEFSQAVTGADEADIQEVVDHHRLSGNLRSKEPIRFINEPVGSTSTIVAMMYRMRGLAPEKPVAVCLCAGLVSDTLNLTSPTTTSTDREILPWLATLADLDVDQFTANFFAAGSMLKDKPPAEALESDRKEFEENGWRLSISQIEELGLDELWRQESGLHASLEKLRVERMMHFACLLVTDISRHDSILLTAGDPRVASAIEYPELKPNVFQLKGVVSRKKQLFPYLGRLVGKLSAPG